MPRLYEWAWPRNGRRAARATGERMSRKRHCPEVFWVLGGHQRGSTSAWRPPRIMPTDRKSTRGRIRSRTLAKIRALQWARSKKVNLGGESSAENPATGSQPRGRMASAQQSRGQAASVHGVRGGTRRSTLKVWVSQRFGLFLIGFWFLLLLCFYMSTGECLPRGHWAGVPQGNWRVRVRGRCQSGWGGEPLRAVVRRPSMPPSQSALLLIDKWLPSSSPFRSTFRPFHQLRKTFPPHLPAQSPTPSHLLPFYKTKWR